MTKTRKPEFRPNEFVVYPAHGVGKIISIEEQEIAGFKLELFVISFEKDKMTLRVPTHKATEVGMRSLSSPDVVAKALDTLKGKAGSSGPCGRAARRNMNRRSTRAT
jgi:CarD family transcriptional regulator